MSYTVKVLKLITGEEVLSKVETGEEWVVLKDARTIAYGPDGKMAMIPLIQMGGNRPVKLNPTAIIAEVYPVDPEMEKKYLSDTSGIAMP